jgi:hypothetical protein
VFQLGDGSAISLGTAPLVRVSYSRDSSKLIAMDSRGAYHVFRVRQSHGYDRIPESWAERSCPVAITPAGDHGRYLVAKFGDGEFRTYDLLAKQETRISALVGPNVLHVQVSPSGEFLALTDKEVRRIRGDKTLDRWQLPKNISSAVAGSDIVFGMGRDGTIILDAKTLAVLGIVTGAAASEFTQNVRENAIYDGRGSASLARLTDTQSGQSLVVFQDKRKATVWSIQRTANRSFEVKNTGVSFLIAPQERGWLSLRRLLDPDILIVNHGVSLGPTHVRQYEVSTGREFTFYQPPPEGWPEQVAEIEDARVVGDQAIILFRYWLADYSGGDRYAVGHWPKGGGPCLKWIDLGKLEDNPVYLQSVGGEDLVHGLFWADYKNDTAILVRFSDGKVIWRGPVAYPKGPAPHLTRGSPWNVANPDFYARTAFDIALGGQDYWEKATHIDLPESVKKRIERIAPRLREFRER